MRLVKQRRGDTLIEVIFAFAILGTIIGYAFTGVIQARRSAVAAQERTQASLMAQYQTNALRAYRDSLPWDTNEGTPNFLSGSGPNAIAGVSNGEYCLRPQTVSGSQYWNLLKTTITDTVDCDDLLPALEGPSGGKKIVITFSSIGRLSASDPTVSPVIDTSNTVEANVVINWIDPFGQAQSVKNIVILTKQR